MKVAWLLAILTVALVHADAQEQQANTTHTAITGEQLVGFCKDLDMHDPKEKGTTCVAYISGFLDGFSAAMAHLNNDRESLFCLPDGISSSQLAGIIVGYGILYPQRLKWTASAFTGVALKEAYPCHK